MTNADLDRKVIRLIRRSPKVGCTEIAERIGEPPQDVRLSLYRLKYARRVRRRGNTKAAKYTAI